MYKRQEYHYASLTLHKDINPYFVRIEKAFKEKMSANPDVYEKLRWIHFNPKDPMFAPDGAVDMVLTFRNVHNWAKAGSAESMFAGFTTVGYIYRYATQIFVSLLKPYTVIKVSGLGTGRGVG